MHHLKAVLIVTLLIVTVACGGKPTTTSSNNPAGKQLDPQGNWLFVVTDSSNEITWGGDLLEVNPPNVTSYFGIATFNGSGAATTQVSGTVSGTNTVAYTVTLTNGDPGNGGTPMGTLALSGTIADDQTHTSGTWTTATGVTVPNGAPPSFPAGDSGTWTAQLIAPITGNFSGTLTSSNGGSPITVLLSVTEDTSQTSKYIGAITGTLSITGSSCFDPSVPLRLDAEGGPYQSVHFGEVLSLYTVPDANGQQAVGVTTLSGVDPNTAAITFPDGNVDDGLGDFQFVGGACGGEGFFGVLTKQ